MERIVVEKEVEEGEHPGLVENRAPTGKQIASTHNRGCENGRSLANEIDSWVIIIHG